MNTLLRRSLVLALGLVLAGCAVIAPPPVATTAPGGWTCVGVVTPPDGLKPVDDPALLANPKVVSSPGSGGLCMGKTYQAEKPVMVYRVWDSAYPTGEIGTWWAFAFPQGPRESYRRENVICPSWSALNRMVACKLKPGATLALGPGQSADCKADGVLPASPVNQVFVPKNAQGEQVSLEDCTASVDWP